MDSSTGTSAATPGTPELTARSASDLTARSASDLTARGASELTARAADVVQEVGTKVGGELLGADLGKELRESALLLGLALVVVGLVAALASTALLLG